MTDRRFTVRKRASQNRPHVTLLVLLLVLLVGAVAMFWPPGDKITQDLDVRGGLQVIMTAEKPDNSAVTIEEMDTAVRIIQDRINALGASGATAQRQGDDRMLVQIPGAVDQSHALETIGSTGKLEFIDVADITDNNIINALSAGYVFDSSGSASPVYSRDQLVSLGGIKPGSDVPSSAELFMESGSSSRYGQIDESLQVQFPTSMTQNPLNNASIMTTLVNDVQWEALRLEPGSYTPIFSGDNLEKTTVEQESTTSPYFGVSLDLDDTATAAFAAVTTELAPTNGKIAILLDGYIQSAPAVQNAITDGNVQITGSYTRAQAQQLQTILDSGSLPVSLKIETSQVIGPTLGQDSLRAGILVAIIGLIIVALYLLFFYKGIGLLTAAAIGVFAVLYLGVLALLSFFGQFALSLAGIAGIVLSIGVAADSSILVLERFKEEIHMGRSVKASSITGVKHAIITSIDADLVTLISALALFIIALGSVRGFGLTLALGVSCDIVTMLLFKAPLIRLLAPKVIARHPKFWGIKEDEDAAHAHGELKRGAENG